VDVAASASTSIAVHPAAAAGGPSPEGYPRHIACTRWGTGGDDVIIGTSGDDVLCGQGGDDVIYGQGGHDVLYGGPGDDIIEVGDTIGDRDGVPVVEVHGDTGDDTIHGGPGSEWIYGGLGDDLITAGSGSDVVWGDEYASSSVTGPGGNDTVDAGGGNDAVFAGSGDDVVNAGTNTQVDVVEGGAGNDVIVGVLGFGDQFYGNAGNDLLFPAFLRADPMGNTVVGGEGNDIAVLANGMMDGFIKGDPDSVSVPLAGCDVGVPLSESGNLKKWGLSCRLIGPVALSVQGSSVQVEVSSDFYGISASWSPSTWRAFFDGSLGSLTGDLCVCDPPIGSLRGDVIS
jgi:Ca2+-binding RTX toxin-like protein